MDRRGFLAAATGFAVALSCSPALAETRRLVVMTSYPQEVISRYLDAFAKVAPGLRVDVVWHSGDDARDYLLGAGKGQVDVYWTPSVRTFFELKQKGALRKLEIDRDGLPARIGHQDISDPDGYYAATEIAGYGLVLNPAALAKAGLPEPKEWTDLAKPIYAGLISMPVPSHIGFAPTITEIILQAYGWTEGWALLARIAANASLQAGRGDDFIGAMSRGEKAIGITIDFFAAQAIAKGAPLKFVYPTANAFEPANIAIPVDAPNADGALAYVNFVLSAAGQRLLVDPDVRRLAVRPSVYAEAPAGSFNPWRPEVADHLSYDAKLFVARRDLDNALFDKMIFEPRDKLAAAWAAVRKSEQPQAEALLTAVPLDEAEALTLAPAFAGRRNDIAPEGLAAEAAWSRQVDTNIAAALALATKAP